MDAALRYVTAGVAAAVVILCALLLFDRFAYGAALPLRTLSDVALPGDTSRLDYVSLDPQSGVLYIAHLGAGNVIAFDTRTNRVIGTVGGTPLGAWCSRGSAA